MEITMEIVINGEMVKLEVGDIVDVSDPKHGDSTHCCSFSGTIKAFQMNKFIIVEDCDFNCFAIESDEIEGVQ